MQASDWHLIVVWSLRCMQHAPCILEACDAHVRLHVSPASSNSVCFDPQPLSSLIHFDSRCAIVQPRGLRPTRHSRAGLPPDFALCLQPSKSQPSKSQPPKSQPCATLAGLTRTTELRYRLSCFVGEGRTEANIMPVRLCCLTRIGNATDKELAWLSWRKRHHVFPHERGAPSPMSW